MLIKHLISGSDFRKTRLHDEKGNLVSLKNFLLHSPLAISTGLIRLIFDYRPTQPWIAYTSIKILSKHLNPQSRVLEFGSGMSTLWYAMHAGRVYSVEDNKLWFDKINHIIKEKKLNNITYMYTHDHYEYCTFCNSDTEGFDLIMIDGKYRSMCIENVFKLVRPGGIIYLDNSDKDSAGNGGDMRKAESLLRSFSQQRKAKLFEITDFAPTQLFVQQGLLVQVPK